MKKIRIVLAKIGMDAHNRGILIVARALREAGMEVIYTGPYQTPEEVAQTALQEDADIVGISTLTGAHMTIFSDVVNSLRKNGIGSVPVLAGGIIPEEDARALKELGVSEVFGPGTTLGAITGYVREKVASLGGRRNS